MRFSLFLLVFMATPATAEELPDLARAMLEASEKSGDPQDIIAVRNALLEVFPDYEAEILDSANDKIAANANRQLEVAAAAPLPIDPPEAVEKVEAEKPPRNGSWNSLRIWDGKFQTGASVAAGNSENLAVNVLVDASRPAGDFVHNVGGFVDYGEANSQVNQKRWGASYQLDYTFSPTAYGYSRISYEEDEFSGFDYRVFFGAGVGKFFAKSDELTFKVEAGPGYRISPIDDTRETDREFAAYGSSELDWVMHEGLIFEQDVNSTWTEQTTTLQSVTALRTDLIKSLSTVFSYELRYETDPPQGRENIDTVARVSLSYGF